LLGREHGIDEGLRRFGEADRTIVLSGGIAYARQHLPLQDGAVHVFVVAGDPRDALAANVESDAPLSITREDVPAGRCSAELPRRAWHVPRLGVSKAGKRSRQIDQADVNTRA